MAKDLFSKQAGHYARFRPGYPPELYEYVLSLTSGRDAAWDAGTGNGQAAVALASHFRRVIATDISAEQLKNAVPKENIQYIVCPADHTPIDPGSIDLVTIAQAYHWFPFESFAAEVRRVCRPGAILAAWTYHLPILHGTVLNEKLKAFYTSVTGPYWDPERAHIDDRYSSIPFPYTALPTKEFSMFYDWKPDTLSGYLQSWSAVQHYIRANGCDPVEQFMGDLASHWPAREAIRVEFPLTVKAGKV